MLQRRAGARPAKRRDRIAALCPDARLYLQEIARRRIHLDNEIRKLERLVHLYGPTDVAIAITAALAQRTFGVRYVRALADQARFARGLGEPTEPIMTGNGAADSITVTPHDLETYDALLETTAQVTDDAEPTGDDRDSDD